MGDPIEIEPWSEYFLKQLRDMDRECDTEQPA
jgi:hypothetical protein